MFNTEIRLFSNKVILIIIINKTIIQTFLQVSTKIGSSQNRFHGKGQKSIPQKGSKIDCKGFDPCRQKTEFNKSV